MFQRLANWLNHYDTVTLDGIEWPLQTRRQKLLTSLRRGLRHPLLVAVVCDVLFRLLGAGLP